MIEVAMVFDLFGHAIFWRGPQGCSDGYIEDSRILWNRLWENRKKVGGIAHTHPGSGLPSPSHTDVTTFAAIESGLGMKLIWPIVTMDQVYFYRRFKRKGHDPYYQPVAWPHRYTTHWMENVIELRRLSRGGES